VSSARIRRALVYTHRWLGIVGCIFFIAWFVSGVVLMYARMPELTAADRRALLPDLDLSTARLSPPEAAQALGLTPRRVRIGMIGARPVYRLLSDRGWTTVFADTGTPYIQSSEAEVVAEVKRALPEAAPTVRYDARLDDADQWTFDSRQLAPLHRVSLGDAAGTMLYLSDVSSEPVMKTTRRDRFWGYAGAVVHWIYFTPFRKQSAAWAQTLIWGSVGGCGLCLSGLVWGVWRFSPWHRYRLKRQQYRSPYAGAMRWHHYAGLLFGFTTFTWIFSGLLSMDPWDWHPGTAPAATERDRLSGGALRVETMTLDALRTGVSALARASGRTPKELESVQLLSEPFLESDGRLVSVLEPSLGAFEAFDHDVMMAAAATLMPDTPRVGTEWLDRYDAYYYDRHGELNLPVLRVRYANTQQTWLYLDPKRGEIVRKEERLTRLNRWLYHGFHSFDFPFLYYRRPLWDVVVIVLSTGGLVSAIAAIFPTLRRFRRHWRRLRSV